MATTPSEKVITLLIDWGRMFFPEILFVGCFFFLVNREKKKVASILCFESILCNTHINNVHCEPQPHQKMCCKMFCLPKHVTIH